MSGAPRITTCAAALLLSAVCMVAPALAQTGGTSSADKKSDDGDAAALTLADQTTAKPEQASDWRFYTEAALRESRPTGPGLGLHSDRLSFDLRYDGTLAPGLRAVFADHYDANRGDGFPTALPGTQDVNTLKEAYLSWQPAADRVLDAGRINVRNGVATGYNPTDFFKTNAIRAVDSLDPASLRENRLGTGMLRGQALWDSGSVTAIYAPRLASQPNNATWSPDLGATNARQRWQFALTQKIAGGLSPQWLLSGGDGISPQLGLNLTALIGHSTVAYVEWSGGRSRSLLAQALALAPALAPTNDDTAFRSRLASGLSYTTSNNITFTAEYDYNGAGLDQAGWKRLWRAPPATYLAYRAYTGAQQDPPTKQGVFLYALWQDALVKNFDLTAFVRYDAEDYSRLQWLEARYHWTHVDLALQTQLNNGTPASDYGVLPERRVWQAVLRYYF